MNKTGLINDFKNIWNQYGDMFLRGAGLTLFIALVGQLSEQPLVY